jgi:endonuclease/exonuclease/phosphatase family metal-dependent hydrolase
MSSLDYGSRVVLLVRTWNVFHGRAVPDRGDEHLERMVRVVCEGGPHIVCLQELPVWACRRLAEWSGMQAFATVTMPALGGPAARRLTQLDPRRMRSALTGQANAVLIGRGLGIAEGPAELVLNPRQVRRTAALPGPVRRHWARNRRVAQILRVETPQRSLVVVNVHLTGSRDSRPADLELLRAATYAEGFAAPGEPIVVAGDLNLTTASSETLPELASWGFSRGGEGIDHILARGLELSSPPVRWTAGRRALHDGRLLSDHAPVEAEMMWP